MYNVTWTEIIYFMQTPLLLSLYFTCSDKAIQLTYHVINQNVQVYRIMNV